MVDHGAPLRQQRSASRERGAARGIDPHHLSFPPVRHLSVPAVSADTVSAVASVRGAAGTLNAHRMYGVTCVLLQSVFRIPRYEYLRPEDTLNRFLLKRENFKIGTFVFRTDVKLLVLVMEY